jgi:hypothetical protein
MISKKFIRSYIHRIELFFHTCLELKVLVLKLIHLFSDLLNLLFSEFDHLRRLLVLLHRQCDLIAHVKHLHIVLVSEFLILTPVDLNHTNNVLLFYINQISQVICNSLDLIQMFLNCLHSCRVLLFYNRLQITPVHVHIEKLSNLVQRKHSGMAMIWTLTIGLSVFLILR